MAKDMILLIFLGAFFSMTTANKDILNCFNRTANNAVAGPYIPLSEHKYVSPYECLEKCVDATNITDPVQTCIGVVFHRHYESCQLYATNFDFEGVITLPAKGSDYYVRIIVPGTPDVCGKCPAGSSPAYLALLGSQLTDPSRKRTKRQTTSSILDATFTLDIAQCAQACDVNEYTPPGGARVRFNCAAVNFYPINQTCQILNIQGAPRGDGTFIDNPDSIYAEKICLNPTASSQCGATGSNIFITVTGRIPATGLLTATDEPTPADCISRCILTDGCLTSSIDYSLFGTNNQDGAINCQLFSTSVVSATDGIPAGPFVESVENGCEVNQLPSATTCPDDMPEAFYALPGETVTFEEDTADLNSQTLPGLTPQECVQVCSSNSYLGNPTPCASAVIDPTNGGCEIHTQKAEPRGPGTITPDNAVIYVEKFCLTTSLQAPGCEDDIFLYQVDTTLTSTSIGTSTEVDDQSCVGKCVATLGCMAAAFTFSTQQCTLFATGLLTAGEAGQQIDSPGTDVIDNGCQSVTSSSSIQRLLTEKRVFEKPEILSNEFAKADATKQWSDWSDCRYVVDGLKIRIRTRDCESVDDCPLKDLQAQYC